MADTWSVLVDFLARSGFLSFPRVADPDAIFCDSAVLVLSWGSAAFLEIDLTALNVDDILELDDRCLRRLPDEFITTAGDGTDVSSESDVCLFSRSLFDDLDGALSDVLLLVVWSSSPSLRSWTILFAGLAADACGTGVACGR